MSEIQTVIVNKRIVLKDLLHITYQRLVNDLTGSNSNYEDAVTYTESDIEEDNETESDIEAVKAVETDESVDSYDSDKYYCPECGIDMGYNCTRQLCGKFWCNAIA